MTTYEIISTSIQRAIKRAKVNEELKRVALSHPRIFEIAGLLTKEFAQVEIIRKAKQKPALKRRTIEETAENFADLFIKKIEIEAENRYKSDIQKALEASKAQELKDLDSTSEGKAQGVFSEMVKDGLVINETETREA